MAAPKRTPCVWQHPFVDVFKTFNVESADRRGDVTEEIDKQTGKRVFRIRGQISANSFLQLPGPATSIRTLGLTGQYLYLQAKALGTKFFLVHLDLTVQSAHLFRITLSNMYTKVKATYHAVQCPCDVQNRWTVACVHISAILAAYTRLPPHAFVLKSVQLCASIYVRNLYTSDIRYTPSTMPREMLLDNQASFEERYAWTDVPGGVVDTDGNSLDASRVTAGDASAGSCPECACRPMADGGTGPAPPLGAADLPRPCRGPQKGSGRGAGVAEEVESGLGILKPPLLTEPLLRVRRLIGVGQRTRRLPDVASPLPRSFAVAVRCAGRGPGAPVSASDGAAGGSRIVVASSMALTLVDPVTRAERCFFGHTEPVELLEASEDGIWVASVQGASEGGAAPPLLRLWRCESTPGPCGGLRCISQLSCPGLAAVRAVAFSPDSALLGLAGVDSRGRQQLLVYDVSRVGRLQGGGSVPLVARQTSADWDIDCLKFSPFEEQHLVTCGRESIRFWRIKDGHLPGCNVVLNSLARQTHFTCVAFEVAKADEPVLLSEAAMQRRRLFVGTAKGNLLQLSYHDRKVQAVYELHGEAITAMRASDGILVTASADKYVKVWLLDFKSYLHAMHETPVVGVDVTVDGLQVICATLDGSVGLLDLQKHGYTDLVRFHGAQISDAAVSPLFQELATVSRDGTLKIWSLASMMQTHKFRTHDDVPSVVAFHPGDRHLVAVGFQSGTLRIFDVDGPALLCEHRHHAKAIIGMVFVSDGSGSAGSPAARLVTSDATGSLVMRDQESDFHVVQCLERKHSAAPPENCIAIACMPPSLLQYQDAQCAVLLSFPDFELQHKLRVAHSTISTLGFSFHARLAIVGTADSKVHLFDVATGARAITHSLAGGSVSAAALAECTGAGGPFQGMSVLVAATADARLKVWQFWGEEASDPMAEIGGGAVLPSGGGRSSQRPPWIARLRCEPFEQCFGGHARAPHRVLIAPRYVVTVSSSEVICWATTGDYFEQLFVDGLLAQRRPAVPRLPEPGAVPVRCQAEVAPALQLEGMPRLDGDDGPVAGAAAAERSEEVAQLVEALQESMALLTVEDVAEEPNLSPIATVVSPTPAVAVGSRPGAGEEAAGAAGPPLPPPDAAPAWQEAPAEQTLVQPPAEELEPPAEELGPPVVELRPLDKQVARGDDLSLCCVSGCTATCGSQAFAWQPNSGILCHTVGNVVHVEHLHHRITPEGQDGAQPDDETLLADLPGLETFALDLEPLGGALLATLSADSPTASGRVWLSLWCLETMARRHSAQLPESYATPARALGARPLLRLFAGGQGAATAVGPSAGGRGRVDVWAFEGENCVLRCSAEPPFPPSGLLLLAKDGSEFLTLCPRTVVFWRCPQGPAPADGANGKARRLLFQVTEEPKAGPAYNEEDAFEFTWFCLLQLSGWQLLLVATTHGRLWAYNADENIVLAELRLTGGERIEALACSQWPTLLCAVGDQIRSFKFLQGSGDTLQAEAAAVDPITLDGQVQALLMGAGKDEGVASTAANTLWYFHVGHGVKLPLQSFHAVPSRALRSNVAALLAGSQRENDPRAAKILASSADDGRISIWKFGAQPMHFKDVGQIDADSICTAMAFARIDLLVCAFTTGLVRAFHLGDDLTEACTVDVGQRDPVLALEAVSQDSVVVGTASGQLVQIMLPSSGPAASSSTGAQQPEATAGGPRQRQLQAPHPASAVCRIERDHDVKAGRFLACFVSLELWIWDCPSGPGCRPRHTCTWVWPESRPRPWPHGGCSTVASCLDMLASPPMVASFILAEGCNLVAVTAPPAVCIYIYNCTQGAVVNRVTLGAQLPRVLRLWSPPPFRPAEGAQPEQRKSNVLMVLSRDRFSRLRIHGSGARSVWLEKEPLQIPGGPPAKRCGTLRSNGSSSAPLRGTPDICLLSNKGGRQCFVMKSDAALSCWVMS